ncbi:DMT family transporter [Rubellimicrobium arenae]|uniref:DMT family transporter n=1 Tax=Rubellimicrobium arenae TaxID=2817372 RepID=UPI001B30CE91|nr:DMT family transporter [Rubellimicrobium arenae]
MSEAVQDLRPGLGRGISVVAMVGSAACWGGATVMTKGALDAIPPFTLLSIQLASSVAVLWLAVLAFGLRLGPRGPALRAASTGLFEPGLAYAVGVPGLALTTAGNASVVAALEPVFVVLLAWAVFRVRPGWVVAGAIGAALLGVCLVSLPDLSGLGQGDLRGDALVLLGTAFAAIYVVSSSRLVIDTSPLVLTCLQQSLGLLVVVGLAAVALSSGLERLPASLPREMVLLAVVSGWVQYALAFWLYLVGLRGLPVSVTGLFLTLTPVFGVTGGMLFLGERIASLQLAGAVLIVGAAGAMLTTTNTPAPSHDTQGSRH